MASWESKWPCTGNIDPDNYGKYNTTPAERMPQSKTRPTNDKATKPMKDEDEVRPTLSNAEGVLKLIDKPPTVP